MEYFAGLFDAEGYVTLGKDGRFQIGTEMANEEIPNLFKETFGGNIYQRSREKRKKTFTWVIATNREKCLSFIDRISPFSRIKGTQLLRLKDYLSLSRPERKELRDSVSHQISQLKKPLPITKEEIVNRIPASPTRR